MVRFSAEAWYFFCACGRPDAFFGPPNLQFTRYQGLCPRSETAVCEACHFRQSSAEIKNEWRSTSTPMPLWRAREQLYPLSLLTCRTFSSYRRVILFIKHCVVYALICVISLVGLYCVCRERPDGFIVHTRGWHMDEYGTLVEWWLDVWRWRVRRETCLCATAFCTDPTWTALGLDQGLRGDKTCHGRRLKRSSFIVPVFTFGLGVITLSLLTRDPGDITECKVGHAERQEHALWSNLLQLGHRGGQELCSWDIYVIFRNVGRSNLCKTCR